MAQDPRTFTTKSCPPAQQSTRNQSIRKKGAIDLLGNLGGIEGTGKIGEGLRVLSQVADTVRSGVSVVPGREGSDLFNSTLGKIIGTAIDKIEEGADIVLDATNIGRPVINAVINADANAANKALSQAKHIFEHVKQGTFKFKDIPYVIADLQNVEAIAKGIFKSGAPSAPPRQICSASPYARDLIAFAPKFKFLFVVQIDFHPEYSGLANIGDGVSFVVKTSTRPNIEFDYEDVNMYNFWTKVPKRTIYQPMTMHFYDDNKNNANFLYTAYLRAMSPISNIEFNQQNQQSGIYEADSMEYGKKSSIDFSNGAIPTNKYSASLGALNGDATSIIQRIKLYHIFDYGRQLTAYNFYNPRIQTFELDELNMAESGDGSDMGFTFAYDSMFIEPNYDLRNAPSYLYNITSGGKFPMKPLYGNDVPGANSTSGVVSSQNSTIIQNVQNLTAQFDPVGEAISNVSDTISNAFSTVSAFTGSLFR